MLRVDPHDMRRWAEDHRAGAARERREARQHPLTAAQAFEAALALLAYDEMRNGSPFERSDAVGVREDEQARRTWTKLRMNWRRVR